MYKLYLAGFDATEPNAATTVGVNPQISFLFDPANTDYRRFKEQVLTGAELQDADGNVMTQEQANEFIGSLP
jgi:hypothetical protein